MFAVNKRLGSKLLKLKTWLTLPDAAKHISTVCNEEITEADILQLVSDGHLKLSVYFVNQTKARRGNIVGREDVEYGTFHRDFRGEVPALAVEEEGELLRYMKSLKIDDARFLNLSDEVTTIEEGIWDLPMIGSRCQGITGKSRAVFKYLGGCVVEASDGMMYQLGENSYIKLCYSPITIAQIAKLTRLELSRSNNKRKEKLLALRRERVKSSKAIERQWLCLRDPRLTSDGLPEDSFLVLRTEVLKEFEQLMLDSEAEENTATKVHGNAERHAAKREQVLGAAFAVLAKWPDECRDKKGEPLASKIAAKVDAMADLFWPDAQPPLATESIANHLRDWIKKANNSRK